MWQGKLPPPHTCCFIYCYCHRCRWHVYRSTSLRSGRSVSPLTCSPFYSPFSSDAHFHLILGADVIKSPASTRKAFPHASVRGGNNARMSALAAASSRAECVAAGFLCARVCVYVRALGFTRADVSNQSPSRGSLSLLSPRQWSRR